eukprot:TRINITY_DN335_c0_g1_i2.p2 TRINITY_DN335_c0_g1~~TRINITY_DN335_c0_g1_i2.p2  ORF type:complete len:160 (+),score=55.48 TRINITY_DN335_c0_g1_i2:56-535(+)
MARSCAVLLLALFAGCQATQLQNSKALRTGNQDTKMWPFDQLKATLFAAKSTPARPHVKKAAAKPAATLESVKDSVILSASFGKKTEALCRDANREEYQKCREIAGNRLFCTLLRRQSKKFEGLDGVKEETERCSTVDIMENPLEATRDEQLQQEANKA